MSTLCLYSFAVIAVILTLMLFFNPSFLFKLRNTMQISLNLAWVVVGEFHFFKAM